jgi:hypothetical protein
MIILDKPYVSSFLEETLLRNKIPVKILANPEQLAITKDLNVLTTPEFISQYQKNPNTQLYTNSENSFNWITTNLMDERLSNQILNFKDKFRFRELMKPFYSDYFYMKVKSADLSKIVVDDLPKPFIIKPNVGFFSLAVYYVRTNEEWPEILRNIEQDLEEKQNIFPKEVLDTSEFIIEEAYEGEEFAIDAYFNSDGIPVILNIYHHFHADETDTGDRLYYTSKQVIETNYDRIMEILQYFKQATGVTNFPMHLECRLDKQGQFGIIEANPMRFAGFCVGDLTWYAYGINPYEYYFSEKQPDWNDILKDKDGTIYAFVLGDFPRGVTSSNIRDVDYEKYRQKFNKLLDLRKIDFHEYPIFAITFVEFKENEQQEMAALMKDDFRDVLVLQA